MSKLKQILFITVFVVVLFGVLGGIKALEIKKMIAAASSMGPPPETITTSIASAAVWETTLTSVGSLSAVQGMTVAAEMPGKIAHIAFKPGAKVRAGEVLLKQDTAAEEAQLRAVEARLTLARASLARDKQLLARHVIPIAQVQQTQAQVDQAEAEADSVRVTITKKIIRAAFAGRLGIRLVNLGQIIATGTPIVSLQAIDPVYANFSLPQQELGRLRLGLGVRLKTTVGEVNGTITAISPSINAATRNVEVQATVANLGETLRPGMFVEVAVLLPAEQRVLAIPAPAVVHATYGDSVFVVEAAADGASPSSGGSGKGQLTVKQQFVRLGERRGDFVAVVSGIKEGQVVASTGVFKLRPGQHVVINNALSPAFKLAPTPSDG